MNLRLTGELVLWEIMSLADLAVRPTATRAFRGGDGGFDRSIERHIRRLEREAYLERQPGGARDRLYRLTEKGRLAALGGFDPEREWSRSWDGLWRCFFFDMPADKRKERMHLWRALKDRRSAACRPANNLR
jgi:DNA-binding transcriptional regulator PaaX